MSPLVNQYNSDSEGSEEIVAKKVKLGQVDSAPDVGPQSQVALYNVDVKTLTHNVPYDAMLMPEAGPQDPGGARLIAAKTNGLGKVEEFAMNDHVFRKQLRRFQSAQIRNDTKSIARPSAIGVDYITADDDATASKKAKWKRKNFGSAEELEGENAYQGPWAGFVDDDEEDDLDEEARDALLLQEMGEDAEDEADAAVPSANIKSRLITPGSERSILHAKDRIDYQGRTYLSAPTVDVNLHGEPGTQECFLPKRCLFTFKGHTKGVNAIRLFPKTGHIFLSASMDGKVKLWDVYNDRRVLRTFLGHNKAVRDISFNNDGTRFLSASFDRYMKLWDTETGKCISAFTTGKVPLCVKFHPEANKRHIFLTGQQDKKIYQFDSRSGVVVQEYDQHLGPVNTVTFVDNNRRFVTTSDDKSLRAWEFDIPVVIKYVAEPHMHSMPSVTISPNKKWLACQSLDNQIMLYAATDKFRLNRKKSFRGHLVAGYACQVNFSADGRFVMSGDSAGSMVFWDFKTCRLMKKFKAHENVVMGCEWLPHETSKILTCSWDSTIKLWD